MWYSYYAKNLNEWCDGKADKSEKKIKKNYLKIIGYTHFSENRNRLFTAIPI